MLWTAKGLWLLYVLGIITGGGIVVLFSSDADSKAMGYGLLLFLSALMGAICLIMQWIGPAGGA